MGTNLTFQYNRGGVFYTSNLHAVSYNGKARNLMMKSSRALILKLAKSKIWKSCFSQHACCAKSFLNCRFLLVGSLPMSLCKTISFSVFAIEIEKAAVPEPPVGQNHLSLTRLSSLEIKRQKGEN